MTAYRPSVLNYCIERMILNDKARSVRVTRSRDFARARHVRLVRYVAAVSADVSGANRRPWQYYARLNRTVSCSDLQ